MSRGLSRADRLAEMRRLYHQRAYTDVEMARRLGVDRTTVYKDRALLEKDTPFIKSADGRHQVDRTRFISEVKVNVREALSLYLAARRASQQAPIGQQAMASALEKLALALRQPMTERLVKAADSVLAQRVRADQEQIFEAVANAWVGQTRLHVRYLGLRSTKAYNDVVNPYLVEPSPWSDSVYLIGASQVFGDIVTYKLDRIESAHVSSEPFQLPEGFDEQALLRYAWGIWRGDGEPVVVKLKFAPGPASRRLKESVWHPLESVTTTDDGGCLWQAPIAEPQEMLPWIRGWGADCEVLEPVELQDTLMLEVSRLAALYRVNAKPPSHMLFWAKTGKDGQTHPLICHLIDVGQVALVLWKEVLTDGFRLQMAEALGLNSDETGRLFAFWAACHDIGKASPNFQRKYPPAKPGLEEAGFSFPKLMGKTPCYHATISALILPDMLFETTGLDEELGCDVAQALGGHHGAWPTDQVRRQHRSQLGDGNWPAAQRALLQELIDIFEPPTVERLGRNETEKGTLLVLLSGLTSVADWIGSMSEYFHFSTPHVAPEEYAKIAARQAERALKKLGWLDWQPPQTQLTFEDLHGFTPRPAQREVIELRPGDQEPTLLIAEIATGTGKTELGLYLADRWAVLRQQRGLYVAMPTQATSNQMHGRVGKYLRKRYPEQQINYHLIHSGARWRDDQSELDFETEDEEPRGTLKAQGWFLPRKRTLLAPFAVGTVDQALMSTLQTRHFFVRLFGLSGKTVIFDEVHAYDTYMNTLFERLLVWLHAVSASVIVLSATLPAATRHGLVSAWRGSDHGIEELDKQVYPSITVASENELYSKTLPRGDDRTIAIEWIDQSPEAIVEALRGRLVDGGCVAIICNRVNRAQAVYEAIDKAGLVAEEDLLLFHARTPGIWRDATEKAVLARFGKDVTQRPRRAIVVATQVIEQSRDLDFDLMVTDLAPIDLLLQRAGRLHRHERAWRPTALKTPTLLVTRPETDEEGSPVFGGDGFVYEPYVLLRSLWTLQVKDDCLQLPEQTVDLIEAVYGDEDRLPDDLPKNAAILLAQAKAKMDANEGKARFEASKRLVATPDHEDLLWLRNEMLEEDDPEVHASLKAMTRLMRPTIGLVCLHGKVDADVVALDAGGLVDVNLTQEPSMELTKGLALRVVTVSHPAVLRHFLSQDVPRGWRDHSLLYTHRKAIFTDGVCEMPGTKYQLRLSQELGLEIVKLDDIK